MRTGPGVTERLARACAAHPRRTFAAWGVVLVVAVLLIATSLHGLTSTGTVSGNPESQRAYDLHLPGVSADAGRARAAVERRRRGQLRPLRTSAPLFRAFVARLVAKGAATQKVITAPAT